MPLKKSIESSQDAGQHILKLSKKNNVVAWREAMQTEIMKLSLSSSWTIVNLSLYVCTYGKQNKTHVPCAQQTNIKVRFTYSLCMAHHYQ